MYTLNNIPNIPKMSTRINNGTNIMVPVTRAPHKNNVTKQSECFLYSKK